MRILLISPLPPPVGGIATWSKKYMDWIVINNHTVSLVDISVIGKRASESINSKTKILDEIKRTIKVLYNLKIKLSEELDVVHLNSSCGRFGIMRDYLCALLVKQYKKPLVVHYHCNIEDQIANKRIPKKSLIKLSKIADLNMVLNSYSCNYLQKETGQTSTIITNFIDNEFILDEKIFSNSKIKKILFTGHVNLSKGVKEIIAVSKEFSDIQFILAGPISNEVRELETGENVIYMGEVDAKTVRKLLSDADVFLFPTYSEGFSIALLEAMAMGLPIITTRVGANADMIEDSGGILVSQKNSKEIISSIKELQDRKYRKEISNWNIDKVKKNYVTNTVMKKLIAIYQTLNDAK